MTPRLLLVALLALFSASSHALSIDEATFGDLSGDASAPSAFSLDLGANTISATSGGGDFDLVALTLAPGRQLDSLVVSDYTGFSVSFIGVATGDTWPTGFGFGVSATALLGYALFGPDGDILPSIATGSGAAGFTPPLGAGTYTFLLQDTSLPESYTLTFNVSALPEAGTLALLGLAGLVLARGRR